LQSLDDVPRPVVLHTLQVLKLSLLNREYSGEGEHADPHMSCKLY